MLYLAHAIGLCRGFFSVGPKSGCGLRLMNVELFGFDGGTRRKHWWWLRSVCQYKRRWLGSSGEWTSRMLKLVSQYASRFRRLNVIKGTTWLVMSRNYRAQGDGRGGRDMPPNIRLQLAFFLLAGQPPSFTVAPSNHPPCKLLLLGWMETLKRRQ